MPLLLRKIENNVAYGDKALYESSPAQEILRNVGFAGKVGTVAQITMLASIAQEIFSNILDETNQIGSRIQNIAKRTDKVSSLLDGADPGSMSPIKSPKEFNLARTADMLSKDTLPTSVKSRYDVIQPMPAIHEIDRFLGQTQFQKLGESAKHYSDSSVFMKKWIADQVKRMDKTIDEKETKKAEKRANRQKPERSPSDWYMGDDPSQVKQKKKSANWKERINSTERGTSLKKRRASYITRNGSSSFRTNSPSENGSNGLPSLSLLTSPTEPNASDGTGEQQSRVRMASVRFAENPLETAAQAGSGNRMSSRVTRPVSRAFDRSLFSAAMALDEGHEDDDGSDSPKYMALTEDSLRATAGLSMKSSMSMYRGSIISWGNVSRRISKCYSQNGESVTSTRTMPFAVRRHHCDSDDDDDDDDDSIVQDSDEDEPGDSPRIDKVDAHEPPKTASSPPPPPPPAKSSSNPPPPSKGKPPQPPPPAQAAAPCSSEDPKPASSAPPPPPPPPRKAPGSHPESGRLGLLSSIATGKRLRPTETEGSSPVKENVPAANASGKGGSGGAPGGRPKAMSFLQELQVGGSKLRASPAPTRREAETAAGIGTECLPDIEYYFHYCFLIVGASAINRILERRKHIQDDSSSDDDSDASDNDWAS
jgi:hypothetical protein